MTQKKFTSPASRWRYNRLTLALKFLLDQMRGRHDFLDHGRHVKVGPHEAPTKVETVWFPTTFFLDRGLAWQTTIAKALDVRGHNVIFSHFDIEFPRRNGLYFDLRDQGFIMAYYRLYTNRLLSGFRFNHQPMSHFGSAQKFHTYRAQVADLSRQQCEAFVYRELPIGQYARNPLIHYFRCSTTTDGPEILNALRDFLAIGMVMVDTFERAFDRIQPTVVFLLNGSFLDSQIQLALAHRRHIRVVTFEAGFMLNAVMLGQDEPIISFPMTKYLPSGYSDYTLTTEQNAQLDTYLKSRSQGKDNVFDYWGQPIFDDTTIRKEIGLAPDTKPDILFTNLLWDSAMLDCDVAFQHQLDWITTTIDWYQRHPQRTLLIRIHPAEINPPTIATTDRIEDAIRSARPTLPSNVIIIPPTSRISSYPLTVMSNVTLVYSSTAGLEAAMMGKPVLVAGKTHYRGQGFTHDITERQALAALLESPTLPKPSTELISDARRYAYFFFFGFNIPFPLVQERPTNDDRPAVEFRYTSEQALLPRQSAELDFIVNVLLGTTTYTERLSTLL